METSGGYTYSDDIKAADDSGAFRLSSVGWCGLVSFGRCSNLLSGGAAFPLLWGGAAWVSPSQGGVAVFFCPSGGTSFSPPLLFGGAARFPFSGWCCRFFCPSGGTSFSPVFCWVVLLGPLLLEVVLRPALSPPPLGDVAFPISFPSPPFGGAAFHPPFLGGAVFSHLKGGAAWFPSSLGGVAFLPLLWVVVLFASLRLGGAAWSTRVVLRCFFSFAWCCLCSPPFGGAAFLRCVGWCCCPKSKRKDAK